MTFLATHGDCEREEFELNVLGFPLSLEVKPTPKLPKHSSNKSVQLLSATCTYRKTAEYGNELYDGHVWLAFPWGQASRLFIPKDEFSRTPRPVASAPSRYVGHSLGQFEPECVRSGVL